MDEQYLSPNQMSEGYEPEPVQNFAIGGIALPGQRAFLRGSDKNYLDQRAKELEAYEAQRQAYNSALTKYQEEVYNPYSSQYDAYAKAVEDWNAGPRTEDYAGPAEPTLKAFDMKAPELAFKEADVKEYQKAAGQRAQRDASSRAVAIDVASNPDKFNFGSMSVAGRFMAEGGPVESDDNDEMFEGIAQELGDNTRMSREQIMEAVDRVAAAGRGGDELLAYLSPESVALLKQMGGSGTTNPDTGLPEFFLRGLRRALNRILGRSDAAPAPAPAPAPAAAPIPIAEKVSAPVMGTPAPAPAAPSVTAKDQLDAIKAVDKSNETYNQPGGPGAALNKPKAPELSDAIAKLKAGDKQSAEDIMRQIVGLPPLNRTPSGTVTPAPAPAPRAGDDVVDMQVVVYGPDGKMYSSPRAAREAGVTNYTSSPPTATAPAQPNIPIGRTPTPMPTFGAPTPPPPGGPATNPGNFFSMAPPSPNQGISPGTRAIGSPDMPLTAGKVTLGAIGANKNLSPTMLGGQENAGFITDRLGNRIYAPASPLLFAEGGLADVNAYNMSDSEEEQINTDPMGSAQKMMADLMGSKKASPNEVSVKRVAKSSGGAKSGKEMTMGIESLMSAKALVPELKGEDSARSQMEALALAYKLKAQEASNKARGLMRNTMGSPTLEKPALTKNSLVKKRFEKGGEVKKSDAKKAEEPGFFSRLFKGSNDDFIKSIKNKAEQNEDYRAMLEYLKSRDAVPDVRTGNLPYGIDAVFSSMKLPFVGGVGRGDIKLNRDLAGLTELDWKKDIGPSTLAHEMAHAADRQFEQQAGEQTGIFSKGNNFTDAYGKLVGSGGMREGRRRRDLALKYHPEWAAANRDYRSTPYEIAAHGVGKYAGPTTADDAPPHIDATAATEFQILLDLARRNSKPAVKRAEGSPKEGEVSQEELDAASRPAFVTPKSGIGRRQGPISRALNSGEAYVNMAKGVTELPYDIAGAPVDIATMALRPLGYGVDKPVMGSDWIKEKMTAAKVRPEPPKDATDKGFYTAGQMLSNLTNPAGVTRSGVMAAQRAGQAASDVAKDFQQYNRQLAVPGASYVSRAPGGYFPTSRANEGGVLSSLDKALDPVLKDIKAVEDPAKREALSMMFNQKAKDFFTKQAGSIQDPLRADILSGAMKFDDMSPMGDVFPRTLQKSVAQGDLQALRLLEKKYDEMLGIKSVVPRRTGTQEVAYVPESQIMGNMQNNLDKIPDAQLLAYAGKKPGPGPTGVADAATQVRKKLQANPTLFATVLEPRIARTLFPETQYATDTDMARYPGLYGTTAVEAMVVNPALQPQTYSEKVAPGYFLPDMDKAIEKGQPILDINSERIKLLGMDSKKMLSEALQMPAEELNQMGFADFLKKAYASTQQTNLFEAALPKVKRMIEDGKVPPADVMTHGIKDFLPTAGDFRWVKVAKPDGVRAIAAGMNNSVGSYANSTTYGSLNKGRAALDNGEAEIYSLYDKNNVPHVTVEYLTAKSAVPDDKKNTIAQLTGNGPLTANASPENYAPQIVDLLNNLRPSSVPSGIKRLLEKTGQKAALSEEVMAPLYFGIPIEALRARDDDLLRQLGAQ